MANTLVVIGWMGQKSVYLNVSKAEAIERYMKDHPDETSDPWTEDQVDSFEFEDEFEVYDIWSKD